MTPGWQRQLKRWPGWLVLAIVVIGLLAAGAGRDAGPRTPDERLEAISTKLACPICDGESVFESRNADSQNIREAIRQQIAIGTASDTQIISFIADRFGYQVLLTPKATGVDALVWALPAAALVCAVAGLGVAFRRWRRQIDNVPDDADRALVAAALAGEDPASTATTDASNRDRTAGWARDLPDGGTGRAHPDCDETGIDDVDGTRAGARTESDGDRE